MGAWRPSSAPLPGRSADRVVQHHCLPKTPCDLPEYGRQHTKTLTVWRVVTLSARQRSKLVLSIDWHSSRCRFGLSSGIAEQRSGRSALTWWAEGVEVEYGGHRGDAGAARSYPGGDVLSRGRVVDEAQPDRPGARGACGGGGLDDDHVGLVAHVQAGGDAYGGRLAEAGSLGCMIDPGHLRATAAAVPADHDPARCRASLTCHRSVAFPVVCTERVAGLSHAELVKAAESAAKQAILGGADVIDDRLLLDALGERRALHYA
jgi:hypothetical protein